MSFYLAFELWYQAPMADTCAVGAASIYKSLHRRMKLQKHDKALVAVERASALTAEWVNVRNNQTKPSVLNDLKDSRTIKETLVTIWGPDALSLGTVSVERAWWRYYLRNVNRSAVWATNEWR